jgi:probable HAF family extracellular repeat protein
MIGLGDLPGGTFSSQAHDVSADGSIVIGISNSASGPEAFRWTSSGGMVGLGDLPGGSFSSTAYGVSADGSVVVGTGNSASGPEAFRWTSSGGMVGLGDLPGGSFSSTAYGVSSDGSIVVGFSSSSLGNEAFIWDSVNGMRNLRNVMINDFGLGSALSGWTLSQAYAISSDGTTFIGTGINPLGDTEAWLFTIPEPSTYATLLLALVASAAVRRYRGRWTQ